MLKGFHFVLIALVSWAVISCKKDQRVLDTSVQPESDLAGNVKQQTLPVKGWTLRHDSIVSLPSPIKMMGSYVDAQVGRTDFGLYFNINFPQASLSFGDNPTLVSADFVFVTTPRFAGDVNAQVSYSVFTLDSTLNLERAYYASNNRLHHPVPLPTVTETGTVEDTAGLAIIRVKLDPTFAQQLISDAAALSSQTAFHAKYKGFYVLASPASGGSGAVYECRLDMEGSGLEIVYKKQGDTANSKHVFVFTGEKAVRYNTVRHDYTGASSELLAQLAGDTVTPPRHLFVQGFGGTTAHLDIPVETLRNDSFKISVNRAELRLKVDPALMGTKTPPALSLLQVGASGRDTVITDQFNPTDNVRYNGIYDSKNKEYVFNVARHVQAILNGNVPNRGFRLVASDPQRALTMIRDGFFEHAILFGPGNAENKPVFTVSYTRVPAE